MSYILIILVRRFYLYNPKYAIKLLLHLITFSFFLDLIYLFLIVPFWSSNKKEWNAISLVRTITFYLTIIIICVKLLTAFLLYRDYKLYPETGDSLTSFNYENKTDFSKPTNPIINFNQNNIL